MIADIQASNFETTILATMGDLGSKTLKPSENRTKWKRGTSVEVAWGIRFKCVPSEPSGRCLQQQYHPDARLSTRTATAAGISTASARPTASSRRSAFKRCP